MTTDVVRFRGSVVPSRAALDPLKFDGRLVAREAAIDGDISIEANGSSLVAEYVAQARPDIETLRNYVYSAIQLQLDAIGYVNGIALQVDIDRAEDGEGKVLATFIPRIPVLAQNPPKVSVEQILRTFSEVEHDALRRCLADLRHAVREPHDTGFFLYRAVESLMQYFRGAGRSKSDAWQALRDALSIPEDTTRALQHMAEASRHGAPQPFMSDENRATAFRAAWEIVDKFVEYVNRENTKVAV